MTTRLISLLLLAPFLSFSQTNYNARWQTVDSLIDNKGLPQSALKQVNLIYEQARKEKNEPQLLKALLFRINLQENSQDEGDSKAITDIEKEIPGATEPARSILQNITASAYWLYLQNHRYQLYGRTNTTGLKKEDIATWTAADLHKKIGELFLASIKEEKLLQATRLDAYDPIIIKGNARVLRPTLFDLLAHQALNYFKTDERDLARPANSFELNDPAIFSDAAAFSHHRFTTSDTVSLHYKALLLLQRLLSFHLADPKPDALLDADIGRLTFVSQYAVLADKDSLYISALAHITDRWSNVPAAAEAWYLQAQYYYDKGSRFSPPHDTTGRYGYVTAKAICDRVLSQKDSSEGRAHCAMLLRNIVQRSMDLNIERVNIPGQPFRALVSWRNFPRLYGRILRLSNDESRLNQDNESNEDSYWQKLVRMPVQRSFSQSLPSTNDYQSHRTELKIDALPVGSYALLTCDDSAFSFGQHPMSVTYFYVSSIAWFNNGRDYFLVNREQGQPLASASVQIWRSAYDSKLRRNVFNRAESYSSDAHGHFFLRHTKQKNETAEIAFDVTNGTDHLFIHEYNTYIYRRSSPNPDANRLTYEKQNLQTYFFTDRSIYRPGQTLYFKGIVVTRDFDTHRAKISSQFSSKIFLCDPNGTKVDSLDITTNDFGSCHGTFKLPANLLNGNFYLQDGVTGQSQYFSVEEYKRPLFFVSYDTLKDNYRVGDTIRIKGHAKAFAGNNIDGAMVSYRVTRRSRYPLFCFDCWPRLNAPQEIAHGTAKTDAKGGFIIPFTAIADNTVDRSKDPVFEYSVSADITDINGETRSGATAIRVGYKSMELSIDQPSQDPMPAASLKKLVIRAVNLAGTPVPALIHSTIYTLDAPGRLIRKRYWEVPDIFTLSQEDYLRSFPHDEYREESDMTTWGKKEKIWEGADSAGKTVSIGKPLPPGYYVIESLSKDKDGQPVKAIQYVSLYDGKTGAPASPEYKWPLQDEVVAEPGEKVNIPIGSSAENVSVIRQVSYTDSTQPFSYLTLNRDRKDADLQVTDAHRGGIIVMDAFVKDNRLYTRSFTVHVPWTDKELSIRYDTYRDKLLPGSEEKWKVTISGHKADKVASEVLAGMYDASLDEFRMHKWSVPGLYPTHQLITNWTGNTNFSETDATPRFVADIADPETPKIYDELLDIGIQSRLGQVYRANAVKNFAAPRAMASVAAPGAGDMFVSADKMKKSDLRESKPAPPDTAPDQAPAFAPPLRKNFNETAFFFPDLRTDDSGSISFSFTMPEALTSWKWMLMAHTKDLAFGYSEKTVVTQKQLMVQPNAPRFLREGDRMELVVKVVNLSDSEMTGQMELQLIDPTTGQTADGLFSNRQANQYFTIAAGQSAVVGFPLDVPYQYNRPLTYRIVAHAKAYSDGEEAVLPVVSNRMLVTESLPINMTGDGTKTFKLDKLLNSGSSETLSHHALTVEFTSNPAWYAVQALPYLMEYPYECAEQTFNRIYANALASHIAGSSPKLQEVFKKWKTTDTAALLSNLEKNQELKSILLQETPWVLAGKSESEQRQHIAMLFDMVRMSRELEASLAKLKNMQSDNGGFAWFKGGPDDRYITQYILTGVGHLQKLNAIPPSMAAGIKDIVTPALAYLDKRIKEDYDNILKQQKNKKPQPAGKVAGPVWVGEFPAQYLYMRSFFANYGIPGDVFPAVNYFRKQAQGSWIQAGRYMQGMIALALFRTGDVQTAKDIMASLKQNAIRDPERGMYWKGMEGGYYWWQAPIETQSLLTEAFHEITPNTAIENEMRTWLLKQKQTHNWATTKATADACYALLMGNSNWLTADRNVDIRLGDRTFSSSASPAEAGTGYFKQVVEGARVQPSMGNITVTLKTVPSPTGQPAPSATTGQPGQSSTSPAWGAVYWQYFENLDKITAASNARAPLKLTKKLFIEKNTDRGPVLELLADNGVLHPGDKVKVRIELQSDRDMEYVHMKDMRAACMEPVNVLSSYKWQGGLGYYESTRDASTDFFFSHISRGTFVFEYPLFVGQAGNFSNGVTSIECMYAPEFGFHSEGIRVNVEETTP